MAVFVALKDKTVRVRRAILECARYGSQLLGSYYSRFIRATRRVAVFDAMHFIAPIAGCWQRGSRTLRLQF